MISLREGSKSFFSSKSCNKRYQSIPQVGAKPQNNEDLQVFWKLKSMSYEIWEIWSQEPCLVLDWKILPRAWKDIGDVAIYFDCYLFCRLHFSHCTCINIALNFGSVFKRAREQQCHKMGDWINCASMHDITITTRDVKNANRWRLKTCNNRLHN